MQWIFLISMFTYILLIVSSTVIARKKLQIWITSTWNGLSIDIIKVDLRWIILVHRSNVLWVIFSKHLFLNKFEFIRDRAKFWRHRVSLVKTPRSMLALTCWAHFQNFTLGQGQDKHDKKSTWLNLVLLHFKMTRLHETNTVVAFFISLNLLWKKLLSKTPKHALQ